MKLSKININKIFDYISQGMTIQNACHVAGICQKTYHLWYNRGKEDAANDKKSLQREFFEGIPMALARCEQTHLQNIADAGKKNWRASAWFLEHTRPKNYGRNGVGSQLPQDRDTLVVIG